MGPLLPPLFFAIFAAVCKLAHLSLDEPEEGECPVPLQPLKGNPLS